MYSHVLSGMVMVLINDDLLTVETDWLLSLSDEANRRCCSENAGEAKLELEDADKDEVNGR
jgi:hypothetical protein